MPDPATQASKRRWSAANRERQREIWRDWQRNRDQEAMRQLRRKYETANRAARNVRKPMQGLDQGRPVLDHTRARATI
jgi:hypothetical protein